MGNLLWLGGAKGVGKSTLAELLKLKYNLDIVNTGNILKNAKLNRIIGEYDIVNELNSGFQGIVDTHYAGYNSGGFVRALSKDNLLKINKSIDLFLVDLDVDSLWSRRKNDFTNDRIKDKDNIARELESNRNYFKEYCIDLNQKGNILMNYDLIKTVDLIGGLIYGKI